MTKLSYASSPFAIRDDLVAAHGRVWERLTNAGTWLDGATRVQVAAEARHARSCTLCAKQKDACPPSLLTANMTRLAICPINELS